MSNRHGLGRGLGALLSTLIRDHDHGPADRAADRLDQPESESAKKRL